MKILHTADWHLDSPFASFSGEAREYLRQENRRLPEKIAGLCRRESCDVMLLAGDVFDGSATRESLDATREALAGCGVPVFISPGNHDFVSADSPWEQPWPENVHIFDGAMTSLVLEDLGLRVYGAGYRSMDCPPLLDGFRGVEDGLMTVAVLHGDPVSQSSPCCPVTASQVRQSGLSYLALGHIHKAGFFRAGDTLCGWPGCPMGRGWDETGEKGVFLVTLDSDAQIRPVALDTPRFTQGEVSLSKWEDLEKILPPGESRDFFRITVTGLGEFDLTAANKMLTHYPHLEFIDRTVAPETLWAQAGEDSLRGVYFRMLREKTQDPKTRDAALLAAEISLALLEGREVRLP